MEPETALGLGLAVLGSKPILDKVLGPTAELVGSELRHVVDRCNVNLDGILAKAVKKLGPRIESPGAVPARVLKAVWEEGRFIEDELAAEYYGGLLAASRTDSTRDDRALTYLALVKDLSTYQIRTHYIVYSLLRDLARISERKEFRARNAEKMAIFIPAAIYIEAMGFDNKEKEQFESIGTHCILGLAQSELIGKQWATGEPGDLREVFPDADQAGMVLRPTLLGAALFLWAAGVKGATGREILTLDALPTGQAIQIQDGCKLLA